MKNFTQKFIGLLALVFAMSFTVNSQEIGDIYQGGYIFQINEDGTGLVSALEDLTEGGTDPYGWGFNGYEWGCYGEYVEGADGQAIGTGYQNTMDIVNQGCSTENVGITAAQAALDAELNGYNDWYLPSKEELEEMYNTIGSGGSEGNIGIFDVTISWSLYLSSSEYYNYSAWGVNFTDGTTVDYGKASTLRVRVIRSVTFGEDEEVATQNTPLDLPQGWSMFGYTCMDSLDAIVGFSEISDKIEIVKDEWGLSYLPSWEFNAIGSLHFSEGYQIKMIEEVTDFQFCEAIAGGASQEELDAAYTEGAASVDITSNDADVYAEGAASVTPEDGITQADLDALAESYEGWCESDLDNDGICDVDEVWGCMDASSCNYVSAAELDDGSCDYVSCLDECGVINGDNSTCLDCAGVVNGTSEDLGCGCGNPTAQAGYDCDGEALQIGSQHAGGIVFQINEDGTGLVADLQDLGQMNWYSAMDAAASATSQGYDDWYLPSIDELGLMYNTIGNGGPEGNIGGFENDWYWSSSEFNNNYDSLAWFVGFANGYTNYLSKNDPNRVRIIRAF